MNRWIKKHDKLLTGEIESMVVPESYGPNDVPRDDVMEEEGVGVRAAC